MHHLIITFTFLLQWAVSYLVDNAPSDNYLYMITVYTGLNRNSGTTSNVRFVITDEKKSTDVRYLDDGENKVIYHTTHFVIIIN